jgi:hypothetical protein
LRLCAFASKKKKETSREKQEPRAKKQEERNKRLEARNKKQEIRLQLDFFASLRLCEQKKEGDK